VQDRGTVITPRHDDAVVARSDQDPALRRRRRIRTVVAVVAVLLLIATLGAVFATPESRSYLDPDSATPQGARALASLLRGEGLTVERVTDRERPLTAPAGTTVVVAYPELLSQEELDRLDGLAADVVLLGAPIRATGPVFGTTPSGTADLVTRSATCGLRAATLAGDAVTGGTTFTVQLGVKDTGETCYPADRGATVVQVRNAAGHLRTVVGTGVPFTNDRLADAGDAALAMNLMGSQRVVLWWLPTLDLTGQQSLTSLLPSAVWPVLGALVLVVLVTALWRGRRLGRVVVEPLPVVVHAAETTQGRARLYQRSRATGTAAAHLRDATLARLGPALGLARGVAPAAVVAALAARTGRSSADLARLLYGPNPDGEHELVTLASQLDALEREVLRT
jgi:hypothetical protein